MPDTYGPSHVKRQIPKSHHYVPQMLLRRFVDEGGKLHFVNKRCPEKGVLVSTPECLFSENHLYTFRDNNGWPDAGLERFYADLESNAAPVVDKLIGAARNGELPKLSSEDRDIWNAFHYHQWKRVPDFHNKFINELPAIDALLDKYEAKVRRLPDEERRRVTASANVKQIKQNARVTMLGQMSEEIRSLYRSRGISVVAIRRPNKSFVISSFPVVKLTNPGRTHFADEAVQAWLPISHDVAVGPGRADPASEQLGSPDDVFVRNVNESAFKQSTTIIAGRSARLVASLAGMRRWPIL